MSETDGQRDLQSLVLLISIASTTLVLSNQRWIRSGIQSGHAIASMSRLLDDVPKDGVVVIGLPARRGDVWFWRTRCHLPCSPLSCLKTSTTGCDSSRIPGWYRCRDRWWSVKENTFKSMINSSAPTPVNYIEPALDYTGTPRLTRHAVDGQEVKHRLEASIGMPVESFSTLTRLEAQTIVPTLMK